MKNRRLALMAGIVAGILVGVVILTARPAGEVRQADDYRGAMRQAWAHVQQADETWEFVVDVEARTIDGEVLATRQAVVDSCTPEEHGACLVEWDWEGESLPTDAHEWVKPRFLSGGYEIPVAFVPEWCQVDLKLCQATLTCEGETAIVMGPSAECLTQLDEICGLQPDDSGFWYAGTLGGDKGYFAFLEPVDLLAEWWESCPIPPPTVTPYVQPTYTPAETYTPLPLPTCRLTSTPNSTYTPLPPSTPYPTELPWPTQPPW